MAGEVLQEKYAHPIPQAHSTTGLGGLLAWMRLELSKVIAAEVVTTLSGLTARSSPLMSTGLNVMLVGGVFLAGGVLLSTLHMKLW